MIHKSQRIETGDLLLRDKEYYIVIDEVYAIRLLNMNVHFLFDEFEHIVMSFKEIIASSN